MWCPVSGVVLDFLSIPDLCLLTFCIIKNVRYLTELQQDIYLTNHLFKMRNLADKERELVPLPYFIAILLSIVHVYILCL